VKRKLTFRPSLADVKRSNNQAMDYYSHLSGKPTPEGGKSDVAPKRVLGPRKPSVDGDGSEASNMRAIIGYLCGSAKVALVVRCNSGMAYDQRGVPIEFSHIYSRGVNGERMKMPDITGMLTNGKCYAVEVKNSAFRGPSNDREYAQENYLAHVRRHGGTALFATCLDDVKAVL